MAGAWNKSRDAWINLLYAMGMEEAIENFLPGKALRLMAGDVAYVHSALGDGLEPDTEVWNKLPLPWEVVLENEKCTKQMILKACEEAKINPEKKGWVFPRPKGIARFSPTPELVHGVVVSNPELAKIFRKIGVFSGKEVDGLVDSLVVNAERAAHHKMVKDKFEKKEKKAAKTPK
jgi:hypothetical protein